MALQRINLSGGSYDARAVSVAAQRCLNLYAEPVPPDDGEPVRFAYYLTPGLKRIASLSGVVRCLYQTTQGDLIGVAGSQVVVISNGGDVTEIGNISPGELPVRMCDNGACLFIVDGTSGNGWYCSMPLLPGSSQPSTTTFGYTVNSSAPAGATSLTVESAFAVKAGYVYTLSGDGIADGTTVISASGALSVTTSGYAAAGSAHITVQSKISAVNGCVISGGSLPAGTTIASVTPSAGNSDYTDITLSVGITSEIPANTVLSILSVWNDSGGYTTLALSQATTADIMAAASISLKTASSSPYGELTKISDDAFYGSPTIDILDAFFLFVNPNTTNWYTSPAQFADENQTPFDSLYVASDATSLGTIMGLAVLGQYIWLFGRNQIEFWYDSGAPDFPFQRVQGVTLETGCLSPYTIARIPTTAVTPNGGLMWLGHDRAGNARVYMGQQTTGAPVSTFPVEGALQDAPDLTKAVASVYQQEGHVFYVLSVPGQSSWVYDVSIGLWHERCSLDANGDEIQHRAGCWAAAYGKVFAGDFENGSIYEVDLDTFTDNDGPIKRQRAFPHLLTDGTRSIHRQFMLDMQNGGGQIISVDWSDDRGASFCTPQTLTLGTFGNAWPSIWRLGLARDRVYRLTWTAPGKTALMGAFIDLEPVRS
ncbi:hypothetical protein [Acetobacter cerevisiae]|uniref:Bacteriophage P22, Gp10, DNA-stabilising n=1 Tax=Acetobacter cerevisiae TaxID=178900 RepID=A0A149Q7H7_9PROT|nr:hypothetical protein [Acetobacter cerevisiae]KXU93311.1 hypothetical protein AD928_09045 [Acetobacter cerevisiae]GBQ10350.1 hypothetical protein AA14362_2524 [Acetobacter cerevisiae DSM 14362]